MQGAESYYNCEDALDKICGIYKNDLADEARSIRIEERIMLLMQLLLAEKGGWQHEQDFINIYHPHIQRGIAY